MSVNFSVMPRIIAIGGQDGAGKSHLATMLEGICISAGKPVLRTSFAKALRYEVAEATGLSLEAVFAKPTPDAIRNQLRSIGAKRREQNANYWVDQLQQELIAFLVNNKYGVVIIDDVRFVNEANMLLRMHAELLFLGNKPSAEDSLLPSFAELPAIMQLAHYRLPAKPSVAQKQMHLGMLLRLIATEEPEAKPFMDMPSVRKQLANTPLADNSNPVTYLEAIRLLQSVISS